MNKKAQQFSWGQLLGLILGLIVLVLVVLVVLGVFGPVGDLFERVPDLDIAANICGAYTQFGINDYCFKFQKIKILGVTQYGTCKYFEVLPEITFEKLGEDCPTTQEGSVKKFCQTLKDEELVNGKPCYVDGKGDDEWGLSREHPLLVAE
jgi:hypothetical protein